jgi:hypothetical protein
MAIYWKQNPKIPLLRYQCLSYSSVSDIDTIWNYVRDEMENLTPERITAIVIVFFATVPYIRRVAVLLDERLGGKPHCVDLR